MDDDAGNSSPFDLTDTVAKLRRAMTELEHGERLYEGSSVSAALAVCKVLSWGYYEAGVAHRQLDNLFETIGSLLPEKNLMPRCVKDAVETVKELRQGHQVVHVCRNDCCRFEGPLARALECPECKLARYKPGGGKKPFKSYQRWSLVESTAMKFLSPGSVEEIKAHASLQSTDGVIRSIYGE